MASVPQIVARKSPEDTADEVLRELCTDELGGLALPIDPVAVARRLGAEVFTSELDPDVDGILVGEQGKAPVIHVNALHDRDRRRFTCAHEVGHLLRRRATGADEFGFVDRRDHLAAEGTDPEERWANRFAGALLIPSGLIRDIPDEQREHPERLAPVFDVSPTSMRIRLEGARLPR